MGEAGGERDAQTNWRETLFLMYKISAKVLHVWWKRKYEKILTA